METIRSRRVSCPACTSSDVARVLYGMPGFSLGLRRALSRGRVVLGGPDQDADRPTHHCHICGHRWRNGSH
ncbi:MAG: hypothetical protein PVH31_03145 [Ectothiorhodospiraceae bacterium]|jgi:hypothetical protein